MVVIKFRKASDAAEFAEAYNGKQFNSMEVSVHLIIDKIILNTSAVRNLPCSTCTLGGG